MVSMVGSTPVARLTDGLSTLTILPIIWSGWSRRKQPWRDRRADAVGDDLCDGECHSVQTDHPDQMGRAVSPSTPDGAIPPCSEIPPADRHPKLASDRHFQPAADRIQNHLFSGTGLMSMARTSPRAQIGGRR